MIRLTPLFALLLFAAACTSTDEAPVDDAAPEATTSAADARPDANNPVGGNLTWPAGWHVRTDGDDDVVISEVEDDSVDVRFSTMSPGWHITTQRPRAIFWHPASTATGDYTASTTIHLFPPGDRREGYGMILGGRDLDGPDQEYLYFLLRRTGEFLVKVRRGDETETVVEWTAHDAIVPFNDKTEGTATNTLSVQTMGSMIHFQVNGQDVHVLDDASLPTQGIVGLRANHGLNLHVETLDVSMAS